MLINHIQFCGYVPLFLHSSVSTTFIIQFRNCIWRSKHLWVHRLIQVLLPTGDLWVGAAIPFQNLIEKQVHRKVADNLTHRKNVWKLCFVNELLDQESNTPATCAGFSGLLSSLFTRQNSTIISFHTYQAYWKSQFRLNYQNSHPNDFAVSDGIWQVTGKQDQLKRFPGIFIQE